MQAFEQQYINLVNKILRYGERKPSRAGDTWSIFGESIDIDLQKCFPLLQGRKIFYSGVFGEMAAFLRAPKKIEDFKNQGCNYWDAWGDEEGNLNIDYGNAWLDYNGVNQLDIVINTLKTNPNDRRMIIDSWRPDKLKDLSLPCCHLLYQFYVRDKQYLDMIWYQRSVDTMIGLPSDFILGALLVILIANETNLKPGRIKFMLGDTHIYTNHSNGVLEYLRQSNSIANMKPAIYDFENKIPNTKNFSPNDIVILDYVHMPAIKFELNV